MNRRGFLSSIIALGAAPAIVRADSIMRIMPRDEYVWTQVEMPLVIVDPENIHDMVSRVLREHMPQIRANIEANNALMRQMLSRNFYI